MGGGSFFAYTPKWRCVDYDMYVNASTSPSNLTVANVTDYWNEMCDMPDGSTCTTFEFENSMHTLVSEVMLCRGK